MLDYQTLENIRKHLCYERFYKIFEVQVSYATVQY